MAGSRMTKAELEALVIELEAKLAKALDDCAFSDSLIGDFIHRLGDAETKIEEQKVLIKSYDALSRAQGSRIEALIADKDDIAAVSLCIGWP